MILKPKSHKDKEDIEKVQRAQAGRGSIKRSNEAGTSFFGETHSLH